MPTTQPIIMQPRPDVKQINYLAKTFGDFKQNFIQFAQAYYPDTYADFNPTSPGMMFIEMASYLGDVMSFYIDNAFKENLLAYAEQGPNIITIAQFLGYKPKLVSPATATAELSIRAPATLSGSVYVPDPKYLLNIGMGSTFSTNESTPTTFRLAESVDFRDVTPAEYSPFSEDGFGNPLFFTITKTCKLIAGIEKTITFSFGNPQKFVSKELNDENVVGIVSVVDGYNNKWYEVDYLAQDVILDESVVPSTVEVGALPSANIRLRKVPRRFVTRINRNLKYELIFGSGTTNDSDYDILIDSRQIANQQYGNGISNEVGNVAINNFNFLNSTAYGLAPSNTTLTVTYIVGGGVESNCNVNTIVNINNLVVTNDTSGYTEAETTAFNSTLQSVSIINTEPATGGGSGDSLDEIKENALMFFNAQNRIVTTEDYVVRSYALPPKYGTVAKAYAIKDQQLNAILAVQNNNNQFVENLVNPTGINLYVLGYDKNKKLATLNSQVKNNLSRYIEQYRMLTDDVKILDAFTVNIGVTFGITVFKNYNLKDTLARTIDTVREFFNIDKWTINQPIILSDLNYAIGSVLGVQNVTYVTISNKYQFRDGSDYSVYKYDIPAATIGNVIYPSLDPCIFELRYPATDIIGNAIQ